MGGGGLYLFCHPSHGIFLENILVSLQTKTDSYLILFSVFEGGTAEFKTQPLITLVKLHCWSYSMYDAPDLPTVQH